ncbi:hypothetical protein ABT160_43130 [Streptomyces sp. NPDC001941]|uniref:hypothetical protein n=1 Tax=Streptomyces sp. NPDC001941 TaxID=3154659 RepID=UPI00332AA063
MNLYQERQSAGPFVEGRSDGLEPYDVMVEDLTRSYPIAQCTSAREVEKRLHLFLGGLACMANEVEELARQLDAGSQERAHVMAELVTCRKRIEQHPGTYDSHECARYGRALARDVGERLLAHLAVLHDTVKGRRRPDALRGLTSHHGRPR